MTEQDNSEESKKNSNVGVTKSKWDSSLKNQRLEIAIQLSPFKTIPAFATKLGYSANWIRMIIFRQNKITLRTAEKICQLLGLGLQDVFDISTDIKLPEDFPKQEQKNG